MYQSIPGTFDILPHDYEHGGVTFYGTPAWREVESRVRGVLQGFGAEEIRTPSLEPVELVARGVGQGTDIVQKEMFTIERGDATFVLRPEVTAPVMRAFLQHRLEQRGGTQRLYYIGPCYRAERPQRGRYRQFHQFGLEIIGADDPSADAECIAAMMAVYAAFGLTDRTRLRINSLGEPESRQRFAEALREHLAPHADQLSETSRRRLDSNPLRILDTKSEQERALLADAPSLATFISEESRQHYASVKLLLDGAGIVYQEDPLLVRGLDYYTRTAFELEGDGLGAQAALAGGGRYDGLAEAVGSKSTVPAVGFAAGIERLFLALAAAEAPLPQESAPDVFLVALGEEARAWAFKQAQELRMAGRSVVFDLGARSMKAQMKEANRKGARFAVIVGEDELASGQAQVRDLTKGDQRSVPLSELNAALQGTGLPA